MDILNWVTGGSLLLGLVGAVCATVVPLALIIGLVIFLVRRSQRSQDARQAAAAWLPTNGVVLSSVVQIRHVSRSSHEIPVVVYNYQVGSQSYQGSLIRAGDQYMSVRLMGDAQKTVARYPAGAVVPVYYNPANPAEAVLER